MPQHNLLKGKPKPPKRNKKGGTGGAGTGGGRLRYEDIQREAAKKSSVAKPVASKSQRQQQPERAKYTPKTKASGYFPKRKKTGDAGDDEFDQLLGKKKKNIPLHISTKAKESGLGREARQQAKLHSGSKANIWDESYHSSLSYHRSVPGADELPQIEQFRCGLVSKLRSKLETVCKEQEISIPNSTFERWQYSCKFKEEQVKRLESKTTTSTSTTTTTTATISDPLLPGGLDLGEEKVDQGLVEDLEKGGMSTELAETVGSMLARTSQELLEELTQYKAKQSEKKQPAKPKKGQKGKKGGKGNNLDGKVTVVSHNTHVISS